MSGRHQRYTRSVVDVNQGPDAAQHGASQNGLSGGLLAIWKVWLFVACFLGMYQLSGSRAFKLCKGD